MTKEERSAYMKKWRSEHAEEIKRYREEHRDELNESKRRCYQRNRDKYLACAKRYRENNKEKVREIHRAYYERNKDDPEFKKNNYENYKFWLKSNREYVNAKQRERYRKRKLAEIEKERAERGNRWNKVDTHYFYCYDGWDSMSYSECWKCRFKTTVHGIIRKMKKKLDPKWKARCEYKKWLEIVKKNGKKLSKDDRARLWRIAKEIA